MDTLKTLNHGIFADFNFAKTIFARAPRSHKNVFSTFTNADLQISCIIYLHDLFLFLRSVVTFLNKTMVNKYIQLYGNSHDINTMYNTKTNNKNTCGIFPGHIFGTGCLALIDTKSGNVKWWHVHIVGWILVP